MLSEYFYKLCSFIHIFYTYIVLINIKTLFDLSFYACQRHLSIIYETITIPLF